MAYKNPLDLKDLIAIAGLGTSAVGGALDRRQDQKLTAEQRAQELLLGRLGTEQGIEQSANTDRAGRERTNLEATQLDPYAQQRALYGMAAQRTQAQAGPPQIDPTTGQITGKADFSGVANQFLNDNALANALGGFERARLGAAGGYATPTNMAGAGLPSGQQAGLDQFQADRLGATQAQTARQHQLVDDTFQQSALQKALQFDTPAKKKTGFWHKLAKIGAIAAPIIAAPFTGGASLLAIGAGAGAASGALDGGWKGALMGGALGAIPIPGTNAVANDVSNVAARSLGQTGLKAGLKKVGEAATSQQALLRALLSR